MPIGMTADETQWLWCAAQMAKAGKNVARPLQGTQAGRVALDRGAGGDRTLEIDRACEEAMHEVLVGSAPSSYRLVSEESGISGPEDATWRVVVDPLDGSLNAKRGLEPFCASVAVAAGPTLGDVTVGYIEDYMRPHALGAVKHSGLMEVVLPDTPDSTNSEGGAIGEVRVQAVELDQSRFRNDLVEVVLLEAGRPDHHHFCYQDLNAFAVNGEGCDIRVRQIGSLALSLCYVAVGIADILVAAVRSRSVDIAAGLLILSEAGGGAAALGGEDLFDQPLDLEKRCAFIAWRAGLDGAGILHRARHLGDIRTVF
ncbi:MAG: inositol monophosphatase family protein [Thermoleophilia bacterium]|jgi:myo-inositol-1(or 4)-monophosphatase